MGGRSRARAGSKRTGAAEPDRSAQTPRLPGGRPSVTASAFVGQSWIAPASVTSGAQPTAVSSLAQSERVSAVESREVGRVAQAAASGVSGCDKLLGQAEPQGFAVT